MTQQACLGMPHDLPNHVLPPNTASPSHKACCTDGDTALHIRLQDAALVAVAVAALFELHSSVLV